MRAFPVRLPSGQRYWTVLDEDLQVVPVADGFLRQQRFGRDGAESTTKAYAHAIALFLRWCARSGRSWPTWRRSPAGAPSGCSRPFQRTHVSVSSSRIEDTEPLALPGRHLLNLAILVVSAVLMVWFMLSDGWSGRRSTMR